MHSSLIRNWNMFDIPISGMSSWLKLLFFTFITFIQVCRQVMGIPLYINYTPFQQRLVFVYVYITVDNQIKFKDQSELHLIEKHKKYFPLSWYVVCLYIIINNYITKRNHVRFSFLSGCLPLYYLTVFNHQP